MGNVPAGLMNRRYRVAGLREFAEPSLVKLYEVKTDKTGNILRDKVGLPVLGRKINA